jgi:hypothetical protein
MSIKSANYQQKNKGIGYGVYTYVHRYQIIFFSELRLLDIEYWIRVLDMEYTV